MYNKKSLCNTSNTITLNQLIDCDTKFFFVRTLILLSRSLFKKTFLTMNTNIVNKEDIIYEEDLIAEVTKYFI